MPAPDVICDECGNDLAAEGYGQCSDCLEAGLWDGLVTLTLRGWVVLSMFGCVVLVAADAAGNGGWS